MGKQSLAGGLLTSYAQYIMIFAANPTRRKERSWRAPLAPAGIRSGDRNAKTADLAPRGRVFKDLGRSQR